MADVMVGWTSNTTERFARYLVDNPPTPVDILGCVCELYNIDPAEIASDRSELPRRMFCYCAHRWAAMDDVEIAPYVETNRHEVEIAARYMRHRLGLNAHWQDDLNLLVVRIIERVMVRKRREPRACR